MDLWDWLAHNESAIVYVSAFIGGVFVICLLQLLRAVAKARADVKVLRSYIGSLNPLPIRASELNFQGETNSPAGRRFKLFTEHLVPITGTTGIALRATRSASELFEADQMLREGTNLRFFHSVPNILVGLGLFFTFLGLTAALHFAAEGATSGDIAHTQASLNNLLQAASFKFISSLVALACSIIFLATERGQINLFYRDVETTADQLVGAFPTITAELLLSQQFQQRYLNRTADAFVSASRHAFSTAFDADAGSPEVQFQLYLQNIQEMLEESKEQTAALKQFDTTLAISISKALDESLSPTIKETFGRLEKTIDQMSAKMQDANTDILQQMVNDFSSTLQARTGEAFDNIVSSAGDLSRTFGAQNDQLQRSFQSLTAVADRLHAEAEEGLRQVNLTVAHLDTVVTRLATTSEAMEAAGAPLSAAAASVSGLIDALGAVQERSSRSIVEIESLTSTISSSLRDTADASRTTAESYKAQLETSFQQYKSGFSQIDKDLALGFNTLSEGIRHTIDQVRTFITESDAGVARAIQGVEAAVSGLDSKLEDLDELLQQMFTTTTPP